MKKLWGGRFEGKTDALVEQLGESVSFDARLAPWDIRGSIAHARMLGDQSIIPKSDAKKIIAGLKKIDIEIEKDAFTFRTDLEDVHMNIESALTERIGDAGKRLHTGRSRNDQIATDMRMWCRDQIDAVQSLLIDLQRALSTMADTHFQVILPGCTHLQHAQPVLLAHHLLAYVEMFHRDHQRFGELRKRVNVMPLGSAALAGTTYPINRKQVAAELDFDSLSVNSMDAVSDRDYLIEFCSNAALVMMHLSRFSEELILWSTQEYNYVVIGDAFTTGSSIMPQKKNPDVAELVRGKVGRVYGDLTALLTLMKGLPMTYNRDLQEDKEPVFDASDTVQLCLAVVAKMIPTIKVNAEAMLEATQEGFLEATDLADYLTAKGMPFRESHEVVGKMVLHCTKNKLRFTDLTLETFQSFSSLFKSDIQAILPPAHIVKERNTLGGTSPKRVRAALKKASKRLN
ncbi:MAG: argininosuccinate lyase [Candidatus Hydrogenedentota bacterium]|nr:MAG: argininosuccinate lyase [Candidatus Hydrogenedentota bacterium]